MKKKSEQNLNSIFLTKTRMWLHQEEKQKEKKMAKEEEKLAKQKLKEEKKREKLEAKAATT
jgi:hypothetical protein